ncbi:MAG: hypothetical protein GF317_01685 [Candidatus Lokiarchaeota archaeon]|nr:hypothetical protein [Candidatus Lokiarchaeota archaeon]
MKENQLEISEKIVTKRVVILRAADNKDIYLFDIDKHFYQCITRKTRSHSNSIVLAYATSLYGQLIELKHKALLPRKSKNEYVKLMAYKIEFEIFHL